MNKLTGYISAILFFRLSVLFLVVLSPPLMAAPTTTAWACGEWKADPKGKCEEIQVCTRTVCTGFKTADCQTETETKCANSIPPKPDASTSNAVSQGAIQTTDLEAEKPSSNQQSDALSGKLEQKAGPVKVEPAKPLVAPKSTKSKAEIGMIAPAVIPQQAPTTNKAIAPAFVGSEDLRDATCIQEESGMWTCVTLDGRIYLCTGERTDCSRRYREASQTPIIRSQETEGITEAPGATTKPSEGSPGEEYTPIGSPETIKRIETVN